MKLLENYEERKKKSFQTQWKIKHDDYCLLNLIEFPWKSSIETFHFSLSKVILQRVKKNFSHQNELILKACNLKFRFWIQFQMIILSWYHLSGDLFIINLNRGRKKQGMMNIIFNDVIVIDQHYWSKLMLSWLAMIMIMITFREDQIIETIQNELNQGIWWELYLMEIGSRWKETIKFRLLSFSRIELKVFFFVFINSKKKTFSPLIFLPLKVIEIESEILWLKNQNDDKVMKVEVKKNTLNIIIILLRLFFCSVLLFTNPFLVNSMKMESRTTFFSSLGGKSSESNNHSSSTFFMWISSWEWVSTIIIIMIIISIILYACPLGFLVKMKVRRKI